MALKESALRMEPALPNEGDLARSQWNRACDLLKAPARTPWSVVAFSALLIALRVVFILHYRIDSDEPQHLHVVWGWTHGQLPYKDLFDNHTPVFQALYAPLFHLFGERADIVLWMRLALLPIYLATLYWARETMACFASARTAWLSAALLALFPPFFFDSIEFRPDQLWAAVWMLTIATLVRGRVSPRRAFGAGLLLGLAFAVSMKTVLLLASLGAALAVTLLLDRGAPWTPSKKRQWFLCVAGGLGGMVVVPLCVVLFFVAVGAGREMYYCVILHNITAGHGSNSAILAALGRLALWSPLPVLGAYVTGKLSLPLPALRRTRFCFFAGVFYYIFLVSFWPVLTAEDYLPFFPAMALTAAPFLLYLARWLFERVNLSGRYAAMPFLAAELTWIATVHPPLADDTADKIGMVADTLKLTAPTDFVMDGEG